MHASQNSTAVVIQALTPPSETVSEYSAQNTSNSGDVSPSGINTSEENLHDNIFDLAFVTTTIQHENNEPNIDTTCLTKNENPISQQINPQHEDAGNMTKINPPVLSKRKLRQLRKANMPTNKPTQTSASPMVYSNEQPQKTMTSMLFSFWKEIVKCCPFNDSDENIEEKYDRLKIL